MIQCQIVQHVTWNNDVTHISLIRDVVNAEPPNVEDGTLARKGKFNIFIDVFTKRFQITKFVGDLRDKDTAKVVSCVNMNSKVIISNPNLPKEVVIGKFISLGFN